MAQVSTVNNTIAADRSGGGQSSRATGKSLAPGAPGKAARWASGAKDGVGTATANTSSVWFTLSHGILTETYYPSIDTVAVRDLELFVTDRHHWFSAEGHDTNSELSYLARGVPAYRLVNTCSQGRYRIEKVIVGDPRRSVVLQEIQFVPLSGRLGDYCLCAMLRPHLGNQGADNTGWIGEFKGVPMLFGQREGMTVALACSAPWKSRSAGFVGVSDGRVDLERHKHMKWAYERAVGGNVALTGEIDLEACAGRFLIAVAFGHNEAEAGHRARASLLQGFAAAQEEYVRAWSQWQNTLLPLEGSRQHGQDLYHISAMVLHTHESKHFPGAVVASLAVPWGSSMGDEDMGYHLVWPRDMSETVGGLLAIREHEKARRVLFYLEVIQEADGHWPQNAYLDGTACWKGIQLDETALVILLVGLAQQQQALRPTDVKFLWPMVRRAAQYLVRHGPVTPMDRWEEKPGYYASTMAAEIPALLVAAELAENYQETDLANYLRETADAWNDSIERLLYVRGTDLARRAGVEGYYVRFAGPEQMRADRPADGVATLPNHPPGLGKRALADIVSPDALALVRFGLRAADDPRIVNTVKVIDLLCKVETPRGPCWHRYTDDGYGEHTDGSPYNGIGTGRAWPLLTGERAHYELAAGRADEADRLLRRWKASPVTAACCPSRSGTQRISPRRISIVAGHRARPCRWSGLTPSMSRCDVLSTMAVYSTCQLKPSIAM